MIYDPTTIQNDESSLEADICIIGSGAGGAISAAKLADKYSIIMLERGPKVTREDFTQNERESLRKLYQIQAGQSTDDGSVRIFQGRCLGGSTTVNWMTCLRTPFFVLNQWADEFGLEDYTPEKMETHFKAVEKRLSVHKIPDDDHNPQNRIILDGTKKLGIKGSGTWNNSVNCIGCGYCGVGCHYDAKQDMRLTYLKDALATKNITIYTGTNAEQIDYVSKNEQVTTGITLGKEYGQSQDRILKIKSKRLIIAGSAIWTPIVLQKSSLTKNQNLGKYLTIHPVTLALGLFERIIDPSYGIPQTTYSNEYINLDGNGYGFWLEVPPVQPTMAGMYFPGLGPKRRELVSKMRNKGTIIVLTRDGANKKSNGEVRWRKNRLSITYKLCREDKSHLLKGLENALEVLFAAGAVETFTTHSRSISLKSPQDIPKIRNLKSGPNHISLFSAHPLGTARMGMDPQTSVVDSTMQMHDYPGVYITDGSVLPTALGVNPMITILATISRAYDIDTDLGM